jgi:hypothetical protein
MQDFLGTVPTTLRKEGAFRSASKLFLVELDEVRNDGKQAWKDRALEDGRRNRRNAKPPRRALSE